MGALAGRMMSTAIGYNPGQRQISAVSPSAWPNPLQPVTPVGPPDARLLAFQFPTGQNLNYTPRFDAEYTSEQLKALATYPLAAVCINNVLDQICQLRWTIQLRERRGESKDDRDKRAKGDPNIIRLSRFFERPDGENAWSEWLRPFVDACLVTDSGALEPMRTKKGSLVGLNVMLSSDTVSRYITDTGRTPSPPDMAYAQLWDGIPRMSVTSDELYYRPRNIQPRNSISSYLYGTSHTQQCAKWLEIGIARLLFQYAYYRSGSVPDMIQVAPSNVTSDKIKEASMWWNSELAGQLDKRRGLSIIQGFQADGKPDQFLFPKEPLLTDGTDDLLIRYIAFSYGTAAQRLSRPMNRASAGEAQESAEEEGTKPVASYVKSVMDGIIQYKMGLYDYEIAFDLGRENDVVKAAQAATMRTEGALQTPNESRIANGQEPVPDPNADFLWVKTASGFVRLGQTAGSGDTSPVVPAKKMILIERGDPMTVGEALARA